MIPMREIVVIDSNCYTYLIDVMFDAVEPKCSVAIEKIAMLKLYLYTDIIFMTSDAVKEEYLKIPNGARLEQHISTNSVLIDSFRNLSLAPIKKRIMELGPYHKGEMDCRVLAEAEYGNADFLLTYDHNFRKHLPDKARGVRILYPSELFALKAIVPGSKPDKVPHDSNPLSEVSFWCI
jgi:predicted nucleic acid-binding protein